MSCAIVAKCWPVDNRRKVQEEFERQATRFEMGTNVSNREYLEWALSFIDLEVTDSVLDVAAGTGLLSRAVAPRVRSVVALDVTAAMLARARAAADFAANIRLVQSDAQHIPFPDRQFDVVMTRLSFHHMSAPVAALREMARVTRKRGQVAVIDLLAPASQAQGESYNRLERLRDPSHARALSRRELETMFSEAGLPLTRSAKLDVNIDVEHWLDLTQPAPDARDQVLQALRSEIAGGPATGMRPFESDGRLMARQDWAIFVAQRP